MKKIIFFALILLTGQAYCQIKVGINAGGAFTTNTRVDNIYESTNRFAGSTATVASYKLERKTKARNSFFAGILLNIPLGKTVSLRPGVYYVQKGYDLVFDSAVYRRSTGITQSGSYVTTTTANYIEVPLNIVFNAYSKKGKFFVGVGPYVAYALSGNFYSELTNSEQEIVFDDEDPKAVSINQVDYGVNFTSGYEFKGGFFINLNFSNGLRDFRTFEANFISNIEASSKNKHQVISLGIGYMF